MSTLTFRALFPFCGVGGGALGFRDAEADFRALGFRARFEIAGGIEWDASTARDFERLTGAPCMVADVAAIAPEQLRATFGECPDAVFFSPPCKPASGLLAADVAATPKYREMAMLGARWVDLMFAAWPRGPRLLIMENVPRIKTRAPEMMAHIRAACRKRGYHITEAAHDLGELGGLAQHRDRLLFVGRRKDVTSLLYQPTKRRVRSVGEVLGALPLPGDPAAGPLHTLPAIEAITALRLALIPAGGDWRDLPSQVHLHPDFAALMGQKRTRASSRTPFNDVWRVVRWDAAAGCVTGGAGPSSGGLTVADPRVGRAMEARDDDHGVVGWEGASGTITTRGMPSNGRFSVADPRAVPAVPFPVIIAEDGTWHRPLTALEAAVLQGFPATVDGAPFVLEGSSSARRVKIGDAVPPPAARRIAEQMLHTLAYAAVDGFALSSGGSVWVRERAMGGVQ